MDEIIEFLGYTTAFSTLNGNSGYCNVEIREEARYQTSFTSHYGSTD